jgi:valyl-tRNA synthetase
VPMAGLIDKEAELARLAKQIAKLEKDMAGMQQRLNNPNFAKAPEAVQAQTRELAAKQAQDLATLRQQEASIRTL